MAGYRLSNSFPYLVDRVGVRIGDMFSRYLAPYDVTLPMYRVMASLWELTGHPTRCRLYRRVAR
jgi:hypothetical protein